MDTISDILKGKQHKLLTIASDASVFDMVKQMVAGRLRAMAPPLALASFAGPMMLLGLASPVIQRMGFDLVPEEAAHELAALWLRGMRPE